jgi:signal transduction histidine kinase
MSPTSRVRLPTGFRLNVGIAAVFSIGTLALFALLHLAVTRAIETKDREILDARLEEYATVYRNGGPQALTRQIADGRDSGSLQSFFVRVATRDERQLLLLASEDWVEFQAVRLGPFVLRKAAGHLRIPDEDELDLTLAWQPLIDGNVLQIGRRTDSREAILEPLRAFFFRAFFPVVLLGLGVGVFISHRTLKPLRDVVGTVQSIIRTGDLGQRVPVGGGGELDEMARLFNEMLQRNERLFTAMNQSLDNVAHDLRTPLTRLRGVAEMALRNPADESATREALADCLEESDRVLTMLRTLMDVAEAEAGVMKLDRKPTRLKQLLEQACELYDDTAEERRIRIARELPDSLQADIDAVRLRQAVANLIDNAVKFSPPQSVVTVSARQIADDVEISVSDGGPGIPEADRVRVFERLYRGDKSRGTQGLGLGLSLVQAIIRAHGGTISIADNAPVGARILVRLPPDEAKAGRS